MKSVPFIYRVRAFIGAVLLWLAFRTLPSPMNRLTRLANIPVDLLGELELGRTFGVITMAWGEEVPAKRMEETAHIGLRIARRRIEGERIGSGR